MNLRKSNKYLALVASFLLSSCGTTFAAMKPEPLPEIPADIRVCFEETYDIPSGAWDKVKTTEVVGSLKRSELEKTSCGRRLIIFYDDLKLGLSD